MFWIKSGVLSDKKIEKFLGKKIYIWPFDSKKLKGATYNLTASCFALSASDKECLVNSQDEIVIPSGETALIQTNESIYVTEDICGTYHSKVSLVTKGLSHIGTTLDPGYFGTSLIAIHNHSVKEQKIIVGDTFVSLMFHKMPKSSRIRHDNQPFRSDLINLHEIKYDKTTYSSIKKDIKVWYNKPWRNNLGELKDEVKAFIKRRDERKNNRLLDKVFAVLSFGIIVLLSWFSIKIVNLENNSEYIAILTILIAYIRSLIDKIKQIIKSHISKGAK